MNLSIEEGGAPTYQPDQRHSIIFEQEKGLLELAFLIKIA